MLALQRAAGNHAVAELLRAPVDAPARPAAASSSIFLNRRRRFEAQLRDRWGVPSVRVGTEADQLAEMAASTPTGSTAPTSIAGWQQWDPGDDHEIYDDILDAFEVMAFSIGGVPVVNEMRFFAVNYENVSGTATARPRHGANYGGGRLNVFRTADTMNWPLPQGRSQPGRWGTVAYGSQSDSRRRVLVHELSHGVFEHFGSPLLGGNTQFFRDWAAAAGWSGGQLVQNGTTLTRDNWNDPWPEQPVSAYATTNNAEDFAESLMCFIEAPGVLRDRSPARHAFIQSRVANQASTLRPPAPFTAPLPRRSPAGDFPEPRPGTAAG